VLVEGHLRHPGLGHDPVDLASKDELVLAVLDLREKVWTRGRLEHEVRRRARTPATRLLAIFDVFDDWFRAEDYEGCLFVNTLLETAGNTPTFAGSVEKRANVRYFVRDLARDAGARNPEDLARKLQLLMTGAIVAATEGDADGARRAHALADLLLTREGLRS
jgi:hypothetical protein